MQGSAVLHPVMKALHPHSLSQRRSLFAVKTNVMRCMGLFWHLTSFPQKKCRMDETSLQWNNVPTPGAQINIIKCYEVSFHFGDFVWVPAAHPRKTRRE